jgi:hypothetical protein
MKIQLDKVGPLVTVQWGENTENTVICTEAELKAHNTNLPDDLAEEVRERLGLNFTCDPGMTEKHG